MRPQRARLGQLRGRSLQLADTRALSLEGLADLPHAVTRPGPAVFACNEQFVDGDSGFGILDAGLAVSGLALAVARPAARPAGAGSAAGQLHDGSTRHWPERG